MTLTPPWIDWIGLPHQAGADPTEGEAACCLVMAQRLLAAAGEVPFPINPQWYTWAATSNWRQIRLEFERLTYPTEPDPWTLVPMWGPPFGLGVLLPERMILIPHHTRGVIAAPLRAFIAPTFHRVRPQ